MTKYLYYPDTLRYAGEVADTASAQFCLTVAPPVNSDPNSIVVADVANNAWIVRLMNSTELASARAARNAELRAAYDNAILQPVSYTSQGGVTQTYQADPDSVGNLMQMLAAFQSVGATPAGFYWVAADNTHVPFTYADMQGLALAMAAPGVVAFAHLQTLKAAVNAAATYAAIQSVQWTEASPS